MKRWLWIVWAAVCLTQLAVPAWMIHRRNLTLREGEIYRFRTRPVDPYDAFRGRYVALDFEVAVFSNQAPGSVYQRGQRLYAVLAVDTQGFARIDGLQTTRPHGLPHLPVRVRSHGDPITRLELPFDRYYLEESIAPEAERLYQSRNMQPSSDTHAVVRVRDGFPVLADLVVDGSSVHDLIKK